MRVLLWIALVSVLPLTTFAEVAKAAEREMTKEEQAAAIKKFEDSLQWKTGEIPLSNGLVKLNLPADFKYLDHANTVRVLEAWGNSNVGETLGMLFPATHTPFSDNSWGVLIRLSACETKTSPPGPM